MKLSDVGPLVVPEAKVVGYLLSPTHPDGRHKAAFFGSFGFAVERWQELASALQAHGRATDVALAMSTEFGRKYVVKGPLVSPDGRNPSVLSVWIVENGSTDVVLVTAYPA
jgi:hypothetical protein